jgi:ArsR family transcriptional regulator
MKPSEHLFLTDETVHKASLILKALADPTRIKILYLLSQESCPVGHMAEVLGMSQSAVSHQLAKLRHVGLVGYRREGQTLYYSCKDDHVIDMLHQLVEHAKH